MMVVNHSFQKGWLLPGRVKHGIRGEGPLDYAKLLSFTLNTSPSVMHRNVHHVVDDLRGRCWDGHMNRHRDVLDVRNGVVMWPQYVKSGSKSGAISREILLMVQKSGVHLLRLVVYPIIYKVYSTHSRRFCRDF